MTPSSEAATALMAAAQRCRDVHGDAWPPARVGALANLGVTLDEAFCTDVANRFERAPRFAYDNALAHQYDRAKEEIRLQFGEVLAAGISVEPWRQVGEPYRDAGELAHNVLETGTIRLFLTKDGHGPWSSAASHPMRQPSGVTVGGEELCYNDLARTVHDLFGHVLFQAGFGPVGELKAGYHHMALSSRETREVLFTEQFAQICWFYFGPHVRHEDGRLRRPGDPGYVPPRLRPYPEQKVFPAQPGELEAFREMFHVEEMA